MIKALGVAAICSLCACSEDDFSSIKDEENEGTIASGIPDNNFVVSYSMDGVPNSTRSANSRPIRSLHYYVYDSEDGTLIKKRKIRDIEQATWPISDRNTMSWELRQDLQDTLPCNKKYRILFIANADPLLFQKEDGSTPKIITGEENYATLRLHLPGVHFSQDNMFFLWNNILDATNWASQSEHKNSKVTLKRIVSQTEFARTQGDEPKETTLYAAIDKGFYSNASSDNFKAIKEITKERTDACLTEAKEKINNESRFEKERNILCSFLDLQSTREVIYNTLKPQLINKFVTKIKDLNIYRQQVMNWLESDNVEVLFDTNTTGAKPQANVLKIDGMELINDASVINNKYNIDQQSGHFIITGFTKNDTSYNRIQSLSFYKAEVEKGKIQNASFQIKQPLNTWFQVVCSPIDSITLNTPNVISPEDHKTYSVNLNSLFGTKEVSQGLTWDELMNTKDKKGLFKDFVNRKLNNLGGKVPLDEFYIYYGISKVIGKEGVLPDLTEQSIKIYPAWKTQNKFP